MKTRNFSSCETCESYGSQSFKVYDLPCGIVTRPDPENTNTHCMVFVLSGRLSVKNSEIDEFVCEKGQILLLMRNKDYRIEVLEEARVVALCFVTSFQVCEKMKFKDAKAVLDSMQYKFCSLEIREPMRLALESILYYLNDCIGCGHWQRAKQTEFFVIFWNYYTLEEICQFFYPVINKEIGFHSKVIANSTKAKTVIELAALCGYKLQTFNKLFAKCFQHTSPYQWMLQQNAPLIKARLLDKTVSIKTVMSEFGFTDQSYFNTFCKRQFGATAAQIRNGK